MLDSKLTLSQHASYLQQRTRNKSSILKRLAGVKWGSNMNTLNLTYKSYIIPILTYGGELMITTSDKVINSLEKVQNENLRIITGATKSTPTVAMRALTRNLLIELENKLKAQNMYDKCLVNKNKNEWLVYNTENRLKTQQTLKNQIENEHSNHIRVIQVN